MIWLAEPDPVSGRFGTYSLLAFPRESPVATKLACPQDAAVLAVILRSQPALEENIMLPLPNPMSSRYKVDSPSKVNSDLGSSAESGDRVLALYGFTTDFFDLLKGKQAMLYNTKATRVPYATPWTQPIWNQLTRVEAENRIVDADVIMIPNAHMAMFSKSSFNQQRPKKTKFYSFGPAFNLHPSLWQLRPIWKTGALVTFSPAFILRHSKELAKILRDMKSCKTWDAYVIPPIIRYCNASISVQRRCPDPKLTMQPLMDAIGMDKILHLLGGDLGGHQSMAIATAPPSSVDTLGRSQWLKRQLEFERLEEWTDVIEHCKGVWPIAFPKPDWDEPDFNVGDLEQAQLADLHAMMLRPESIPYRRFIYLGEMSTPFEREGHQGLEPLSLDQFHAAFASAV